MMTKMIGTIVLNLLLVLMLMIATMSMTVARDARTSAMTVRKQVLQASNVSWCPPDSTSPQKGARSQGGAGVSSALSNLLNRWYPQNLKLMIMHLLIGNQVLF